MPGHLEGFMTTWKTEEELRTTALRLLAEKEKAKEAAPEPCLRNPGRPHRGSASESTLTDQRRSNTFQAKGAATERARGGTLTLCLRNCKETDVAGVDESLHGWDGEGVGID